MTSHQTTCAAEQPAASGHLLMLSLQVVWPMPFMPFQPMPFHFFNPGKKTKHEMNWCSPCSMCSGGLWMAVSRYGPPLATKTFPESTWDIIPKCNWRKIFGRCCWFLCRVTRYISHHTYIIGHVEHVSLLVLNVSLIHKYFCAFKEIHRHESRILYGICVSPPMQARTQCWK